MNRPSLILALETSCDDTAAAVVQAGRTVLSSVRVDQNTLHQTTGGVVPEVAARQHLSVIHSVVEQALNQAQITLHNVDAVAATVGPGLVGSLLVGATVGKSLAVIGQKPFIPVHHLVAHLCSAFLESDPPPAFIALLVSGGHTLLAKAETLLDGGFKIQLLGETLDDAAGETYDKVGRFWGLGFPAGQKIDQLAASGSDSLFHLPIAKTALPYDFSFSGLKTAAIRLYQKEMALLQNNQSPFSCPKDLLPHLCAAFQQAVITPLVEKTLRAAQQTGLNHIVVCGGVSANQGLQRAFYHHQSPALHIHFPAFAFCTDNAAMVAAAAYWSPYYDAKNLFPPLQQEVFSHKGF
ncbi:MAG: tRNA (adenosine(37)-N6)-threonylcarbamoyltransferase complex transferase subunit TsaD [Vampirovibrionales bacterium]